VVATSKREGPDLFDRAEARATGLAQGAVDSPGFRHAHLGTTDQRRDVRGISVAVARESLATRRLANNGSEDPVVGGWVTEFTDRSYPNRRTTIPMGQPQESGVVIYQPLSIQTKSPRATEN